MLSVEQMDSNLVHACRNGDKYAFDVLVKKYHPRLIQLVARYAVDPNDTDDITQDVLIKAFRSIDKFRGESSFYTWIYRIAINTVKSYAIDYYRNPIAYELDMAGSQTSQYWFHHYDLATPERLFIRDELDRILSQAFQSLPEALKTAICLREFKGLAYEDIARVMDCPVGTVRSRIFRAREMLDDVIEPYLQSH